MSAEASTSLAHLVMDNLEWKMAGPKGRSSTVNSAGEPAAPKASKPRAARLLQEDVPAHSLEEALRVPTAIADNYAFKPTRSLNVAGVLGMGPAAKPFRNLTGAALAYGLTTGAAQAPEIGITPLGMRIVRPTAEGDDLAAKREALLRPRIVGEFLRQYDGAALPSDLIAKNVLQEKGVPADRLDDVLKLIVEGAHSVGFIREWNGRRYVDLATPAAPVEIEDSEEESPAPAQPTPAPVVTSSVIPPSRAPVGAPVEVSVGPGIHINIEIHIAADASSQTIEEIFRNMRRYVLDNDGQVENDATTSE